MIHVTPPQGPIEELKNSPLTDASGFVDIDKFTMRHKKFSNVFSLGDCSNAPISKTAAAISGQSDTLRRNLMAVVKGQEPESKVRVLSQIICLSRKLVMCILIVAQIRK